MVEDDQYLAMKIMQEFKKTAPVNLMRHISSYEEFLQNTEYKIYDIILLDICLSAKANDDNGFSILEYVRKKDKKIPIIIISNMVQYDYLEKAFQL
jgi:two-component SAPR family response regulator